MRDPHTIILRPMITEKSMDLVADNKYVFQVDMRSNKVEIAEAVRKMFKVEVDKVNTLIVKGKKKRLGRMTEGKTPDIKKAYVTLKPGHRIEMFEGA